MPLQPLTIPPVSREPSLLSPVEYDGDAVSIRSDQDSDSDDDELQLRARNSRELRAADRMVFMEEDETDKLVTDARKRQGGGDRRPSGLPIPNPLTYLSRRYSDGSQGPRSPSRMDSVSTEDLVSEKRRRRRDRRKQKKERLLSEAQDGEDGELMYEMEGGRMKEGSSTGESSERDDSDEIDRRGLEHLAEAKGNRRRNCCRWVLIYTLIATAFAILVLVAWKLSIEKKAEQSQSWVSNGTALFAPTTLIISLDGFRADFLNRGLTPRLNSFIGEGVSPLYMLPSFPSVTFPNHYTLATGLYPEAHGIVGNTFWDPDLQEEFYYTDPHRSLDPKWWNGEPFWVTAEASGIRTAIHMWPGSEAHIRGIEPSFLDAYNGKELLENKVSRVFEFLDKPGMEDPTAAVDGMRPQLIAMYVPNVDGDGHRYGPNSTEIRATIKAADDMLDDIFRGLEQRNLTRIVNVIVVSDHGMATTDVTRLIQLDDLVDLSRIEHIDGWPLVGLRPKKLDDLQQIYDGLAEKAKANANIEVYLRDVNMPERYHFSRNDRIAPLWIVPKTGWGVVQKSEINVQDAKEKKLVYHPMGLHGYDHEHPLMRAIFVARGPAFPHVPNSRVEVFQNTEVYNILCDSLHLAPRPNNGTLRLPLKSIGTHSPETPIEEPADPVSSYTLPTLASTTAPMPTSTGASIGIDTVVILPTSSRPITVDPVETKPTSSLRLTVDPAEPTPPPTDQNGGDKSAVDEAKEAAQSLWDWFKGKLGDIWDKVAGSKQSG